MRTILLVDDDPFRAFSRMAMLQKRFPDVRRVANAAEALCLVEEPVFSANLALVISDHHLSGLGGPAFVAELHSRMPALPVLVLGNGTGDAADYLGDHVRFLPTSYATQEMLRAAAQLLTRNGKLTA